ncbi:MAG: mechanosensitive ion channel family protein [Ruminococcaceae bacterium]|nr:mechanosensitive ion channel family protein [Oscillospiraceae bacterium]
MTIREFLNWVTATGWNLLSASFKTILLAVLGYLLIRLIMRILKKFLENSKLEKAAHSLIKTLVKTVLYVLLGLILASSLGIDVTGIVALASVATLAISLALQNMLANVIGGFTLLYTHPFSSNDYVEIAGQSGTVKEVGIAYTKLVTPDNKIISIPNSAVVSAEIVNYTITGTRRVDITVSAAYNANPETVVKALLTAAEDKRVRKDPAPYAGLSSYGDSAISYVLRVWVNTEDYWDVYNKINREILDAFQKEGIEMTYPHLNVHLEK